MELSARLRSLRWQRNTAALVAVGLVLTGFGLTLPRTLARYRALRAAQAELIGLQQEITHAQARIVEAQKQILDVQRQIGEARGSGR